MARQQVARRSESVPEAAADDLTTAKRRVARARRNGKTDRAKPQLVAASDVALPGPDPTDWRFHLASLMRVSDNLVSFAVGAYERVFALDKREESEIYLELGKKLIDEEKLDEALRSLRRVLRARPDHHEALFLVGKIHLRRKEPLAAIEMLQKASAAGMKSLQLHLLLADALGREERIGEALKEIDCALAIKPRVADTHYRRALLLDRVERYPDAVESLQEAIRLAPREVRYHQSLGFALETMGRRDAAIKCFKRALELERTRELEQVHVDD